MPGTRPIAPAIAMVLLLCAARAASAAEPDADGAAFFEAQVRPLLVERCYRCHSAEGKKFKGGLRLDSRPGMLKGGDTGPALVPGDAERSLLITAVRYGDPDLQMPPKERLPAAEVAILTAWIARGAPDPRATAPAFAQPAGADPAVAREHWAYRPLAQ
ncbi:MAG: hypothetical protein H0X38_14820, partial [Planctomycetes bacterium]|nr:hypothetical protein [Planctomycetota bacterium]